MAYEESLPKYEQFPIPTTREAAQIAQYHSDLSKDPSFQVLADLPAAERRARVEETVRRRLRTDLIYGTRTPIGWPDSSLMNWRDLDRYSPCSMILPSPRLW